MKVKLYFICFLLTVNIFAGCGLSNSYINKIKTLEAQTSDERLKSALNDLIKDENQYSQKTRRNAIGELLKIKGKIAVEALIHALKNDNDSWVRGDAAEALGKIKDLKAVEPLIYALKNDNSVRACAAEALGDIKDPKAVEPLIHALKNDKYYPVREYAAKALGEIQDPKAAESLIYALKNDKDEWVRNKAGEALGKIKDPKVVDLLIYALKNDKNSWVRWNAAGALGEIKDPKAVEPLIHALKNEHGCEVRLYAAKALGEIQDPKAAETLIYALKDDKNKRFHQDIGEALGKIKDPKVVALLIYGLKNDKNSLIRWNAAVALGEIKDPKTVDPLCYALKNDDSSWIREKVAEVLGKIKDPKSIDALTYASKNDEHYDVRREAGISLELIKKSQLKADNDTLISKVSKIKPRNIESNSISDQNNKAIKKISQPKPKKTQPKTSTSIILTTNTSPFKPSEANLKQNMKDNVKEFSPSKPQKTQQTNNSPSITFPNFKKFNSYNNTLSLNPVIYSSLPIQYAEIQDIKGITIAELKSKGENNYSCQLKNLRPGTNKFKLYAIDTTGYEKTSPAFIVKNIPRELSLKGWYNNLHALVVGIDNYKNPDIPKLYKAESDTRKIAELLQNMGFNVQSIYGSDATKTNIINQMLAIQSRQMTGDAFLFFFSGHGHIIHTRENKRIGYIVPYDSIADLKGNGVILYDQQCISIPDLQNIASDMTAKHTAFFLDSCFSGRLTLASKGSMEISAKRNTGLYETLLNQRAINLLTSGSDKPVYEGNGEYSPFVQALINGFEKGSLDLDDRDGLATFGELAVYVHKEVMRLTNGEQQPQYANFARDNGQLIFKFR